MPPPPADRRYYLTCRPSPLGPLTLVADDRGRLVALWFAHQRYYGGVPPYRYVVRDDVPIFTRASRWLRAYFLGRPEQLEPLPLAPRGTAFRLQVWRRLQAIPFGQVRTYGEIASAMALERGAPLAAQAVGNAVGHNPLAIVIPCHRVIAARGRLGGYAGGLERKRRLLRHESAAARRAAVGFPA